MEKLLYELPIERYVELYTSLKTAQEFKTFEDSIIKQPSLSTFISDKNILCLNWCIIDADDWTGLAIHYQIKQNDIVVNEGIYYDDSIYSYALKGLQHWSDIIQLSI
ncbi:hypothetical protein SAMN02910451_02652 [Butyrivibrio hungatei]|uniref:Uncharacterized protein n=1 Tax=Butyrivibrio hungatei TaxID=185008 RepID=A0A1G5G068_9FIRM|nr:hypothetical protein [Butyrivibrio hungatei]SCY44824.1 hypothetical protein SAMN02910451_02652 [Butyrivibrio hungatei]